MNKGKENAAYGKLLLVLKEMKDAVHEDVKKINSLRTNYRYLRKSKNPSIQALGWMKSKNLHAGLSKNQAFLGAKVHLAVFHPMLPFLSSSSNAKARIIATHERTFSRTLLDDKVCQ